MNAGEKEYRGHGPLLQVLITAAAAVFLLYLAYPRLHASLLYLPVDTAINRYYDKGEPQYAQLEGLRERARQAIGINPHHRYYDGLSLLHFISAADSNSPLFQRRGQFEQAITTAEASLDRAPSQPRTWLRIAQARSWLRYPPEQVIDALKMAIYTGRVEPSLFMTRLTLGLAYLPRMDSEGTAMMRDQVLLAWKMQPRQLVQELKTGRMRAAPLASLLSEAHQTVLAEIEEAAGGPVR
jgi:hypothetical protein